MPGEIGTCSYPGLQIRWASMTFSRGVTPSIATIICTPYDGMDLPPSLLRFDYGGTSVQFPDAAVMSAHIRRRYAKKGWLWSVQIVDRRWRWAFGSISGEYNKRTPKGLVDDNTRRDPSQLMSLLLDAMGESNYDVSRVPEGVYPYVKWGNVNPALALAGLCDYVACDVCYNHLTNAVEIWPLGSGSNTPVNFNEEHPKYRYTTRSVPSSIKVQCGDSRFQNKLRLRAVLTDSGGVQEQISNSSLAPADGFGTQALHFPGVSGTDQALVLDQAWKNYRISGQANGSLFVPQCQETITSTNQYLLDDYILEPNESDLSDYKRNLPYYIDGDYWPYASLPNNTSDKRWLGQSQLLKDRRMVRFDHPVIGLSSSGAVQEPTIYLTTSYRVASVDGNPVQYSESGNAGGSGGQLVLRRPEIFATYQSAYSGANETGSSNTQSNASREVRRYIQIFQNKYNIPFASEITYPGIFAGTLDGVICQARWECGTNREAKTMACENEELDVTAVPKTERRRREVLRQIAETLG